MLAVFFRQAEQTQQRRLRALDEDVVRFMRTLEESIILTLGDFGITAARLRGFPGVWVGEAKVGGRITSLAGGLLEPIARANTERFIKALEAGLGKGLPKRPD